ncbi:MAG: hypothetical protein H6704_31415 [Myxococcales bacterium]|nr:hypothetical protein [Myxococcales bacterium]
MTIPSAPRPHVDDLFAAVALLPGTAYVLDADLRIERTNAGWRAFARANDGAAVLRDWGLGRRVTDAITPETVRAFHVDLLRRAFDAPDPITHDYQCPSAATQRRFRMTVHPTVEGRLVVVHTLLAEVEPTASPRDPADVYVARGITTMCCHCRHTARVDVPGAWDWVPHYLASPPPLVSHGLCPTCDAFYYPPEPGALPRDDAERAVRLAELSLAEAAARGESALHPRALSEAELLRARQRDADESTQVELRHGVSRRRGGDPDAPGSREPVR